MVRIRTGPIRSRLLPLGLVLALALVPLASPGMGANLPCCPAGDPSIGITRFHQIMVLQGDDPNTVVEEPKDRLFVLDRTYWSIPWNNTEVYTYIPPLAKDISLDHVVAVDQDGTSVYLPGEFSAQTNPGDPPATGWTREGTYSAFYSWRFPEEAQRGRSYTMDVDSTLDFRTFDGELTNGGDWDTSGGMLMLLPDLTSSTYVSGMNLAGLDILSVDMSIQGRSLENMTFDASADNGTIWSPIVEGTPLETPGPGNEFRWRVSFTQDGSMQDLPALERVVFDILYTPESTDIWLETSYTLDLPEEGVEFDFSFPFDGDGTGFIVYVYTDDDMPFGVNGTDVEQTVDPAYVGKRVYRHLSGYYASLITLAVNVEEPRPAETEAGTSSPWIWVMVGLVLLLVALLGMAYLRNGGTGVSKERGE